MPVVEHPYAQYALLPSLGPCATTQNVGSDISSDRKVEYINQLCWIKCTQVLVRLCTMHSSSYMSRVCWLIQDSRQYPKYSVSIIINTAAKPAESTLLSKPSVKVSSIASGVGCE